MIRRNDGLMLDAEYTEVYIRFSRLMGRELFPFRSFLRSKCVGNHGCMALIVSVKVGGGGHSINL